IMAQFIPVQGFDGPDIALCIALHFEKGTGKPGHLFQLGLQQRGCRLSGLRRGDDKRSYPRATNLDGRCCNKPHIIAG
ncbi:hypothetical protein, partial [Stenotrophomonas maltophilia]|uniref:hypothetical protein n=1 Tax=Stenotrophomonas maltophilia TaxID=40324 RepID=UPI0013D9D099